MAKKEGNAKEKPSNWVDTLKETLSTFLIDQVKSRARELIEEFVHKAQDIIYQTEKHVIDNFSAAILALAGFILVVVAFAYFMMDFFKMQKYWGFLMAGLILIIVSLIIKKTVEKTKYYDFGR